MKKEFTCGVMTHKVYVDAACHLTDIFLEHINSLNWLWNKKDRSSNAMLAYKCSATVSFADTTK